jgi:hypothetical protein
MREEKMKETLERADFFIEIRATSDAQKPEVLIRFANGISTQGLPYDISTQTEVTKYQDLQQLTDALVELGVDRRDVDKDLARIYRANDPDDPMTKEPACYTRNITFAQARRFGWTD